MPTLSKRFIEIEIGYPTKGQVIYHDDRLPGFVVRVTKGCKYYIVKCRVNGINRRITIGKHGVWTSETARAKAREPMSLITGHFLELFGRDPKKLTAQQPNNIIGS